MAAVTSIGLLFAQPLCKPLSTAGQFQAGCYLVFTNTTTSAIAPVYRDPQLLWPFKQTSVSGSGPGFVESSTTGISSDGSGRFPAIYLNPAISYTYNLYSMAGSLIETGPATGINVPNTASPLQSSKISTTTRINSAITNDPDLQIALGVGIYRIEADLSWFAGSGTSLLEFTFGYSGSLNAQSSNQLLCFGLLNNASTVFTQAVTNTVTGSYTVNTTPNQNTLHVAGTVQTATTGTLALKWGCTTTTLLSLGAGSALYATPL